jgi:hypothetical protein
MYVYKTHMFTYTVFIFVYTGSATTREYFKYLKPIIAYAEAAVMQLDH